MSLPIKLPVTARPTLTANIFTGTFNVPTVNRYNFTDVAGNQQQTVLTMTGQSVYIIERASFSMTTPEGVFQEAIDSTISVPVMKFETLKTQQLIFARKQPFINYVDNLELLLFVPSNQEDDEILVSFEAIFSQPAALVGTAVLKAFLQLNIYEVQNSSWVARFMTQNFNTGKDLSMRGNRDKSGKLQGVEIGTFS